MSSPLPFPSPDNDYVAPVGTRLNVATWDLVFGSIGARIRALEAQKTTIEDLINELQVFGLQRLDQAIVPLIEEQQAKLAALQLQIATSLSETQALVDSFITTLSADIAEVQEKVDTILAGGIPAANVTESATQVFVTPAQRSQIDALADTLADQTVAVDAALADLVDNVASSLSSYEKKWGNPTTVSATTAIADHQHLVVDTSVAAVLINFPTGVSGVVFRIQKQGVKSVLLGPGAAPVLGDLLEIDGHNICLEFKFNGTKWVWY